MKVTTLTFAATVSLLAAACSANKVAKVAEYKEYVQPEWYMNCKDIDTESNGVWFWNSTTYYYSCGSSLSGFESAAQIKAMQVARRNMADRLNGVISSGTKIRMSDIGTSESMTSETETEMLIVNNITDPALRHYATTEHYSYKMNGNYHSFVMIKLSKENVDEMIEEALAKNKVRQTPPEKQFSTSQLEAQ